MAISTSHPDARALALPCNAVALIWLAGIVVALAAYAIDPAALLQVFVHMIATVAAAAERLVLTLSAFSNTVTRALAVGLFATFVALALLAIHHQQKAWTALVAVSCVFLLLVREDQDASNGRWLAAFTLAATGAVVMTARLRRCRA